MRRKFILVLLIILPLLAAPGFDQPSPSDPHGISGDEIYSILENLDCFDNIPADTFRSHFFFDPYDGDDLNPGTRDRPMRSATKWNHICLNDHTECTVLGCGRVYSPILIEFSSSNGIISKGETITWDGHNHDLGDGNAAETGTVLDVDYGRGILAISVTTGHNPVATNTVTGDVNGGTITVGGIRNAIAERSGAITGWADAGGGNVTITSAGHGLSNGELVEITATDDYDTPEGSLPVVENATTDTFEIEATWVDDDLEGRWAVPGPGNCFDPSCGTPGKPCALIGGEQTGECRPVIDNNGEDVFTDTDQHGAWFCVEDDDIDSNDQLAVENLVIQNSTGHTLATQNGQYGGTIIALNIDTDVKNDADDDKNSALAIHGWGWIVDIGSKYLKANMVTTAQGSPIYLTGAGGVTVIGDTEIIGHYDGGVESQVIGGSSGSLFLLGPDVWGEGDGSGSAVGLTQYNWTSGVIPEIASEDYSFVFARTMLRGTPGDNKCAFGIGSRNATAEDSVHHDFRFYETTLAGGNCLLFSGLDSGTADIIAKGIVADDCTLNTVYVNAPSPHTGYTGLFEGVYDEDDVGNLCTYDTNKTKQTAAECEAGLGSNFTFFTTNSYESGTSGTDGAYYSDATFATSNLNNLNFADADPDTITSADNDDFIGTYGFAAGDYIWVYVTAGGADVSERGKNSGLFRIDTITGVNNEILTMDPRVELQAVNGHTARFREWEQPNMKGDSSSEGYGESIGRYTVNIEENDGCVPEWVSREIGRKVCSFTLEGKVGAR